MWLLGGSRGKETQFARAGSLVHPGNFFIFRLEMCILMLKIYILSLKMHIFSLRMKFSHGWPGLSTREIGASHAGRADFPL